MSQKKFLVGVGNVTAMQGNNVVFTGQTLMETGIELGTESTPIRGGFGNQLQNIYYHTSSMTINITETQWSLPLIALNVGSEVKLGGNGWDNQTITTAAGKGTLVGITNSEISSVGGFDKSVYVNYNDTFITLPLDSGDVTFDTLSMGIPDGTTLCVSYLEVRNSDRHLDVPANFVPTRVRLFITANLSGDVSGESGFIGTATIEVPVLQLSGSQTISMTADGYSETPLTGMAIAYTKDAVCCDNNPIYATITEHITNSKWYDNATALQIEGGDQSMPVSSTRLLRVWYVSCGRSFRAPSKDLTFSCSPTTSVDVGANTGLLTSTATAGTGDVTVFITNKSSVTTTSTITVEP